MNAFPFQEKKLSNKIDYEILKEVMDSESSVMKPFYPCRAEIISSLGGDPPDGENALKGGRLPKYKCVPSSSTTANQSDTAVLPGKKVHRVDLLLYLLLFPSFCETYFTFCCYACRCCLFLLRTNWDE